MTFVAATCPACAGALQVPDDRDIVKCMYCGVDVVTRQAIQLISGNASNFFELATAAAAAGNYAEAYDYYTKVLEIEPQNAEAWLGKATAAGWLSTLSDFRFSEMMVGIEQAIKFSSEEQREHILLAGVKAMGEVGVACFSLASKHVQEFVALQGSWPEYISRCRQIITLYEVAHTYDPENRVILENIIYICKNNIEGIAYNDPYDNNASKSVFLADNYEQEIRGILTAYAERLQKQDPNYQPPNPQKQTPGCFVITATMGDERHPHVLFLRSFRDDVLVRTTIGSAFVRWYYQHGPVLARRIANSNLLRTIAFAAVVVPAVGFAKAVTWLIRRS
jgi:tetratricopeptide (TPR) repeat protein